jgi:hypothetical protein
MQVTYMVLSRSDAGSFVWEAAVEREGGEETTFGPIM